MHGVGLYDTSGQICEHCVDRRTHIHGRRFSFPGIRAFYDAALPEDFHHATAPSTKISTNTSLDTVV